MTMARAIRAILTLSAADLWTAGPEQGGAGHYYDSDGARGRNAGVGGQWSDHSGIRDEGTQAAQEQGLFPGGQQYNCSGILFKI